MVMMSSRLTDGADSRMSEWHTYLFGVYRFATDADFYEVARVNLHFKIVSTAWSHGRVAYNSLEGVAVADCHSHWPQVLVDKLFFLTLVEEALFIVVVVVVFDSFLTHNYIIC